MKKIIITLILWSSPILASDNCGVVQNVGSMGKSMIAVNLSKSSPAEGRIYTLPVHLLPFALRALNDNSITACIDVRSSENFQDANMSLYNHYNK